MLASLGVQHMRSVLVHGGFLLADVQLPDHKIALLLEGQGSYVRNTGKRRGERTLFRTSHPCTTARLG